jgi:FkbM family methyltransferase
LPVLVKHIEDGAVVVDVGANCADTLAAMVEANPRASYVCIEPDEVFFSFLTKNIERIKAGVGEVSVCSIRSLVGKKITGVRLKGAGGTKHAEVVQRNDGLESQRLDDLLLQNDASSKVRLLKSDVDGYDYDVIDSAERILATDAPLVFFECQWDHQHQCEGYMRTLRHMQSLGYVSWSLFDNFGELVLHSTSLDSVFQLLDYVWRQNLGVSTRTIFYFDVLATTARDAALVNKVLADYVQLHPSRAA